MNPIHMCEVIDRKKYDTETATLIAGNDYWDGSNFERHGRNCFLYRTPRGNYFATHLTRWQGEIDHLEPLSEAEAIELFEQLAEKRIEFESAFPDVEIEVA